MTKTNFGPGKTPSLSVSKLEITPNELELLEKTEAALRRTQGCAVVDLARRYSRSEMIARLGFNMKYVLRRRLHNSAEKPNEGFEAPRNEECDTVGCIGGWMEALDDTGNFRMSYASPRLYRLFYPYENEYDWDAITPRVAAEAIKRFRTTGEIMFSGKGVRIS